MTDLAIHLERLGLEQYLDAFIAEGFDQWETILDIQESDLDALGVKLGHRRKLQRAIAEYRGISYERLVDARQSDVYSGDASEGQLAEGSGIGGSGGTASQPEQKRKYRRHPKQDENAPEKPPSAYVLFSNKTREDVKAQNLSFTEIAKLVGERWQKLDPAEKEPFESHAQALKESYHIQLSAYKKTDSYKSYAQYLADFKAKHGQAADSKRPKLDPQSSGGSLSAASDPTDIAVQASTHVRGGSIGSPGATSQAGSLPSPPALSTTSAFPNLLTTPTGNFAQVSNSGPVSPSSSQFPRDRRLLGQLSTHQSTSDDMGQMRNEMLDPLSRTATLSLNTPPASTTPLATNITGVPRLEHSGSSEPFSWPITRPAQQATSLSSPHGTNLTLPSPTINVEPWRERNLESQRQPPSSSSPHGGFQPPLTLAPIMSSNRLPDLTRVQTQRMLPPPLRQYPTSPPATYAPHQVSHTQAPERNSPRPILPIEHHESEAASTLAGLAKRSADDQPSRTGDNTRWF